MKIILSTKDREIMYVAITPILLVKKKNTKKHI